MREAYRIYPISINLRTRLCRRGRYEDLGFAVTEEPPPFDHFGNLLRHHSLPRTVLVSNPSEHVSRENVQHAFVEIGQLLDTAPSEQVLIQVIQVMGHLDIFNGAEQPGRLIPQGIDVDA